MIIDDDFFEGSEMNADDLTNSLSGLYVGVELKGVTVAEILRNDYIEYKYFFKRNPENRVREILEAYSADGTIKSALDAVSAEKNSKMPALCIGTMLSLEIRDKISDEEYGKAIRSAEYAEFRAEEEKKMA